MKKITLYRGIALNEGEVINAENIGCSWTLCEVFAQTQAENIANARGIDGVIVLRSEVPVLAIDIDNTLFAMERRGNEYEVVVSNTDITAEVIYSTFDSEGEIIKGNTGGNMFEDYIDGEYDGELTEVDFFALAEEFGAI